LSARVWRLNRRSARRRRSRAPREGGRERVDGGGRGLHQQNDLGIARRFARLAALLDFAQAVAQGLDDRGQALGVVEQVVLQIGVALDRPDLAQHLIKHAGAAPGAALGAQGVERRPGLLAQQAQDDLPIRERGVVVWNLTQARDRVQPGDSSGLVLRMRLLRGIHGR
jgi:hypothetical protein